MKYFCVDEKQGKYVEVDEVTDKSRVFIKGEMEKQITEAKEKLSTIPASLDDKALLVWAKANHPQNMDYSREKEMLQDIIVTNKAVLEGIK